MNKRCVFSAPGKLVLAGEFAVLEGFEALSCAVSRRVTVSINADLSPTAFRKNGIAGCVVKEFKSRGFLVPQFSLDIDSTQLYVNSGNIRLKLGLGSSAAIAVAMTSALFTFIETKYDADRCLEIAQAAHRHFTRNSGSGIDVATSFFGGVVCYQLQNGDVNSANVTKLEKSQALNTLIAVHTGIKQSTVPFLKRVHNAKKESFVEYDKSVEGIAQATKLIINLFRTNSLPSTFQGLYQAVEMHNYFMEQLGRLADIEIFTKPHYQINQIANKHGGIAKPSGAGGDFSLCFVNPEQHNEFIQDIGKSGFYKLDADFCGSGVESII